ncbi:hypothetical protein L5515_019164 [Caenorhabditis briggsae]|uniref:Uncharacterized protein n=1 Tax=Caenorhabditis briggsae TaxID=6238 RepID=A0AAE9FLD6_CAEBR|nr:hypothetical protein L5515_019164 [Caenorhabditis briggsae]
MALQWRQFRLRHYFRVSENDMNVRNHGYQHILGSAIIGIPGDGDTRNRLYPNFVVDTQLFMGDGVKYFLIDKEDKRRLNEMRNNCQTLQEKYQTTKEVVRSLSKFQEFYPQKRVYLRLIQFRNYPAWNSDIVFFDEAVEVAAVVLKQQGAAPERIEEAERILARRQRDNEETKNVKTITIYDLNRIFERYGLDRSRITLVPDLCEFAYLKDCHQYADIVRTLSPHMNVVMDFKNVLFCIFTCGVQGSDVSPAHRGNRISGKNKMDRFRSLMQRYFRKRGNGRYIVASKVHNEIEKIMLDYNGPRERWHQYETRFLAYQSNQTISFKDFNLIAKALNINRYDVPSDFRGAYPIWMARVLFSIAHLQQAYKRPSLMTNCIIRQFSLRAPPEQENSVKITMMQIMAGRLLPMEETVEERRITRDRGRRTAERNAVRGDWSIPREFEKQIKFKHEIEAHLNLSQYVIREEDYEPLHIRRKFTPPTALPLVPDGWYFNRPAYIVTPIPPRRPQLVPPAAPRPITPRPVVQPPDPMPVRADSPEEFLNQNPADNNVPAPNPIRGRWMMRAADLARMWPVDLPAPQPANQFVPQLAPPPPVNPRNNHPDLFRRIDELRRLVQPADNFPNMNDMPQFVNWNQRLADVQDVQQNGNPFPPQLVAPQQPAPWNDDQNMDWDNDAERFVPPPINDFNNFNNFNAIDMPPMGQFGQWQFGQNDIQRIQPLVHHMALAAPAPQVDPQADPWAAQQRFMDWIAQAQEFMQQFALNVPNVPIDMDQIAQWHWDQIDIARQAWEQQELQNQLQNQFGVDQFQ